MAEVQAFVEVNQQGGGADEWREGGAVQDQFLATTLSAKTKPKTSLIDETRGKAPVDDSAFDKLSDLFQDNIDKWTGEAAGQLEDVDADGHPSIEDEFSMSAKDLRDADKDVTGDNSDLDMGGDGLDRYTDTDPKDANLPGDVDKDQTQHDVEMDIKAHPQIENLDDQLGAELSVQREADADEEETAIDPDDVAYTMDKREKPLPTEGYNEHSSSGLVEHDDMETTTEDWGTEWPMQAETRSDTMKRLCSQRPRNTWCQRRGYA